MFQGMLLLFKNHLQLIELCSNDNSDLSLEKYEQLV